MPQASSSQFNILVGYFFNLNYILGVGFLSIPFTFYHSGFVLCFLTLTFLSICSCISSLWILEIMARINALYLQRNEQKKSTDSSTTPDYYISETRKYEYTEICDMLFGIPGKLFSLTIIVILIFIVLWAYATVAATAWSVNIPINTTVLAECSQTDFIFKRFPTDQRCSNLYRVCLAIFGVIIMVLSSLELNEQKYLQVSFAIMRFIVFVSLVIFSIFIIIHNIYNPQNPIPHELNNTNSTATQVLTRFDIVQWFIAVPIIAGALNITNGIPSLSHNVIPKRRLKQMYISVFLTLWFFYAAIGVLVSFAFLNLVNENAALNWKYFTQPQYNIVARIVSYYIVLFPSLDVISLYPLYVTSIANNIYQVVMCRDTSQGDCTCKDKIGKLVFRLVCAFLPLIGAAFISNLVTLLKIGGIFILFLGFLIPATCQLQSKRLCRKQIENCQLIPSSNESSRLRVCSNHTTISPIRNDATLHLQKPKGMPFSIKHFLFNIEARTPYSGWYSSNFVVIIMCVVGVFCFCLTIVSLL